MIRQKKNKQKSAIILTSAAAAARYATQNTIIPTLHRCVIFVRVHVHRIVVVVRVHCGSPVRSVVAVTDAAATGFAVIKIERHSYTIYTRSICAQAIKQTTNQMRAKNGKKNYISNAILAQARRRATVSRHYRNSLLWCG